MEYCAHPQGARSSTAFGGGDHLVDPPPFLVGQVTWIYFFVHIPILHNLRRLFRQALRACQKVRSTPFDKLRVSGLCPLRVEYRKLGVVSQGNGYVLQHISVPLRPRVHIVTRSRPKDESHEEHTADLHTGG